MKRARTYQVREIARIAGISVRALHHYEAISLLVPVSRTPAGYRLYDNTSLMRLQQILIKRELGFSLEEIRRSLDDPGFDHRAALTAQREALHHRLGTTRNMIKAVDRALAFLDRQLEEDAMDMKDLFEGFDPTKYEAEARERFGNTDAHAESQRRTKGYKAQDWKMLKQEQDAIYREAAAAMQAATRPSDAEAMDIAERHRLLIERWFYPCGFELHRGLADLYEADSRFAANIDAYGVGLTVFLAGAIRANARRHRP
jgi:DNA-binding transcriptional MerR regulator